MRTAALLTIALALAWTAGAQQAPAPKAQHAKLMTADTNKDGKVSFEELSAVKPKVTQEQFKRMDRNADGVLSPADRAPKGDPDAKTKAVKKAAKQDATKQQAAKGGKQEAAARLKAADTNGDGRITSEEFQAAFPKASAERFAKLDRNKDGALTPDDKQNEAKPGKSADARHAMAAKLRKSDADGDGKVTFEEASAAKPGLARADFDRFDTNKDGAITKDDGRSRNAGDGQKDAFMKKLRAADTNADERVSWEEAHAAMPDFTRERFDRIDRNKDGFIAKDDRAKQ